jgi:hypothetical protein
MSHRSLVPALAVAAALATAAPAAGDPSPDFSPGHVVVRYDGELSRADRADIQRKTGTRFEDGLPGGGRTLVIKDGDSVEKTLAELRRTKGVRHANPDYEVRAAGFMPNDPGRRTDPLGSWTKLQWNFFGPASVNAPDAWEYARSLGAPGGRGAIVAVVDELGDLSHEAVLCDISLSGGRIEQTSFSPPLGAEVVMTFTFSLDAPAFEVIGRVVRQTEPNGFAIQFESMDAGLKEVLDSAARRARSLTGR